MDQIIDGVERFRSETFPGQKGFYQGLARHGQHPKAMVISCSDSRVIPEIITSSRPGDIFVTRNAGNIIPPYGETTSGVTAAIEYAVIGLEVEHLIVCGHTECGAMKAVLDPTGLERMPSVAKWLDHCTCAQSVFKRIHGKKVSGKDAAKLMAMENVVAQLAHLRTHPTVAARTATGDLTLHGWVFDIETGTILGLDGDTGTFSPIGRDAYPVAQQGARGALTTRQLAAAE